MKIQFVSDLHLEFEQNRLWLEENPLEVTGDILLVAGDTAYLDVPTQQCTAKEFQLGYISHGEFLRNGFQLGRMIEV